MATPAPIRIEEPEERLFRIGEVSRLTGVKAFVLRYWEQEIPTLQPVKTPTGHRLYRREDIDTVFEIKRLLYEDGFTLAGARKHLAEVEAEPAASGKQNGELGVEQKPGVMTAPRPTRFSKARQKTLLDLHEELLAILTLLERG
ncbi:MAG TPA: MerR family transcriptional regulator [Candidatus Acidoferrales bacterium]|nr:MerR family transcriptional regulator [Candidatus Acidoferrales bacterium]